MPQSRLKLFVCHARRHRVHPEGPWNDKRILCTLAPGKDEAEKGFFTALTEGGEYGATLTGPIEELVTEHPEEAARMLIESNVAFIDSRSPLELSPEEQLAILHRGTKHPIK